MIKSAKPEDPIPLRRDLAEDEPDLPDDDELQDLAPPLPNLQTDPMAPMKSVPPGPETDEPALAEAGIASSPTLEELADDLDARQAR